MKVTLIQQTENPIELISKIASICYDSEPDNPSALVKHLYNNGHHSVFEHIYFTFKIEGISRACSHQLVRHRMASFTQRSQRYCSESGFNFVTPPEIIESGILNTQTYLNNMWNVSDTYKVLTENGISNEDARFVLPNACETELYMSFNLREFIHICNERLCERAQSEIRELTQKMVNCIDKNLKFMLVPKCQSGRIICNNKCKRGNNNGN